jgi:hypothetical protein
MSRIFRFFGEALEEKQQEKSCGFHQVARELIFPLGPSPSDKELLGVLQMTSSPNHNLGFIKTL